MTIIIFLSFFFVIHEIFQYFDEINLFFKVLLFLIILSIYSLVIYYLDYYRWEKKIKENIELIGHTYVETHKDWTIFRPYSWIWPIPTDILTFDKKYTGRIDNQYYLTKYAVINSKKDELVMQIAVYDVYNGTYITVSQEDLDKFGIQNVLKQNFIKKDFWVHEKLCSLVIDFVKPYYIYGMFGESLDISGFISSGEYSIKEGFDSIAISLTNNFPYRLSTVDYKLINSQIKENPELCQIITNTFDSFNVKYFESKMQNNIVYDLFKLNALTINGVDTTIEFTFSHFIYPNSTNPNKLLFVNE